MAWLDSITQFFPSARRSPGVKAAVPRALPVPRTKVPAPTEGVGEERRNPPAPIRRPSGHASWDLGPGVTLNPWGRISPVQNFGLYAAIRETLPIVDAAIVKKRQLLGCPRIDAKPETKAEVTAWLNGLHVHGLQRGWGLWLATFGDNALHFGRAHTEILLTNSGTDVWGLHQIHPKTVSLRPAGDRFSVEVVQTQPFAGEPTLIPAARCLNWIHEVHGDDPNGTSLLWGLPFVAEIMQKLFKNLGTTWDRFGTPRYHINWEPPEDWDDPTGSKADDILADLAGQFNQSLESGAEGDIIDFYTAGKVSVSIIGAEGEALVLDQPMKEIATQVITKTNIPPSAFGLAWAQGEQITQFHANLLTVDTDNLRSEVHSELAYLIDFRQRLTGGDRKIRLIWERPTLIDIFNQTRSDFFKENAAEIQRRNLQNDWRLGVISEYDYVRAVRPEFSHLSDEEIGVRLPDLSHEAPEAEAPGDNGPGRTGTGGGGGLGPGSATGRALSEGDTYYALLGATNGKH